MRHHTSTHRKQYTGVQLISTTLAVGLHPVITDHSCRWPWTFSSVKQSSCRCAKVAPWILCHTVTVVPKRLSTTEKSIKGCCIELSWNCGGWQHCWSAEFKPFSIYFIIWSIWKLQQLKCVMHPLFNLCITGTCCICSCNDVVTWCVKLSFH